MSRKGVNIHKRKDGRWEARVLRRDGGGMSKYISLYGKTYKEAKEKMMNLGASEKKVYADTKGLHTSTVINEWLINNSMNLKKSTKLKYKVIIDSHILPVLGNYNIRSIDENVINQFLSLKLENGRLDQKGGLSNSYVKTMGIILTSVLKYATSRDYCEPLKAKICKPSEEKREINILSVDMQVSLENKLQYDRSLTALGVIIALNTGLRIGELCALRWEDIDLEAELIHVRHTVARVQNHNPSINTRTRLILDRPKTKSSIREIPIISNLLPILIREKPVNLTTFVVSGDNTFISPRTFEYRFHRILETHKVPHINFHSVRHSFATRCIALNVDVKTLSEILGHATVGITLNTYVHPSLELKRNQLEKITQI